MTPENPRQARPEGGQEPRRDTKQPPSPSKKPEPKVTKPRPGSASTPGPGLPDYGDQEPGDPRRIEIEGQPPREGDGGSRSEGRGRESKP